MCGQEGFFGTSAFQVVLNIEEMLKLEASSEYRNINETEEIEQFFGNIDNPTDPCSINNLSIQNNVISIKPKFNGNDDDEYNPGF
jgi:predicted membrane protein